MEAGIRRPLQAVKFGIVWPCGIARANLMVRNPEASGLFGITRDSL